jgi:hypothetical protein
MSLLLVVRQFENLVVDRGLEKGEELWRWNEFRHSTAGQLLRLRVRDWTGRTHRTAGPWQWPKRTSKKLVRPWALVPTLPSGLQASSSRDNQHLALVLWCHLFDITKSGDIPKDAVSSTNARPQPATCYDHHDLGVLVLTDGPGEAFSFTRAFFLSLSTDSSIGTTPKPPPSL